MAISQLTTANTFEQWLIATQQLIGVANTLTDGNLISTGTITITGSNLGVGLNVQNRILTGSLDASYINVSTLNVTSILAGQYSNVKIDNSGVNVASGVIKFPDGTTQATASESSAYIQSAYNQANSANILAQAAFDKANTVSSTVVQAAFDKANSANVLAQAAFDKANTDVTSVTITATTYGNASHVATITTAANGRISSISNTLITINATNQITSGTLPIARGGTNQTSFTTGNLIIFNGTSLESIANTGTAGTYGNSSFIPVITTDAYGRISAVSNTRILPRTTGITSNATITPTSNVDQYNVTSLGVAGGNVTIAAPSGSPVDGQKLIIRIKDAGVAQTLNWTYSAGAYRNVGVTAPVSTVANKLAYVGCIYNTQDNRWDVVAVIQEA